LREKLINIVDYKPKGDKEERLISQIDLFMGGSVLLPKDAPWLKEFESELLSFPGRHDDQVDALSQGGASSEKDRRNELKRGPIRSTKCRACKPLK
jgi:phage terminase large subunit-like protein